MRFQVFHDLHFTLPLMVDYSWLLVAGLHFWLVARFYLPQQVDEIGVWKAMIFAVLMTVLMFGSIIVHELAHALVAKLEHIRTIEIRLHIFGGYARLAIDPQTAMAELRIAIAGPVASFLLGVIFMLCLLVTQATISGQLRYPLQAMFMYLFTGNVALARKPLLALPNLMRIKAVNPLLLQKKTPILKSKIQLKSVDFLGN